MLEFTFRDLYNQLVSGTIPNEALYEVLLVPSIQRILPLMPCLLAYGQESAIELKGSNLIDGAKDRFYIDLWNLYALSRISDLLLLPFQSGDCDHWTGPTISQQQRLDFFTSLGLQPFTQYNFHPFYHEIVEVEEASDSGEPIEIKSVLWQGLMIGTMMFCRAGVSVRGGIDFIKKDIAEHSRLYFAYRRRNRSTHDLSDGWGSNSQWRTKFRRDYHINQCFYYNIDGKFDISRSMVLVEEDELDHAEAIELLRHRCFILCPKGDLDLYPFNYTYLEILQ